jgi:lactoylglutathione lyase
MKFKLSHTNINVTDLQKSLDFYKSALGLKETRRHKPADDSFELVFLTDESAAYHIELTWLRDKEGAYELGDNETHIAFETADIDAARALHREMNCICYENEKMGIYFIEDPDGYWLEILPLKNR